jgi:hypothetical protein
MYGSGIDVGMKIENEGCQGEEQERAENRHTWLRVHLHFENQGVLCREGGRKETPEEEQEKDTLYCAELR